MLPRIPKCLPRILELIYAQHSSHDVRFRKSNTGKILT
jgi:hypothetical protein